MRSIRIPFPLTHQHAKGYKNKIMHKKPSSSDYLQKPNYILNSLTWLNTFHYPCQPLLPFLSTLRHRCTTTKFQLPSFPQQLRIFATTRGQRWNGPQLQIPLPTLESQVVIIVYTYHQPWQKQDNDGMQKGAHCHMTCLLQLNIGEIISFISKAQWGI